MLSAQEKIDLGMVTRIRYEGFHNSKVMDLASGLMDAIGERLTGSPNMKRANEWTRDQLASFGLQNAHLEAWGPFGRGWANEFISLRMVSPDVAPLIAYADAWTPGTNGILRAKCVRADIKKKEDFDKYRGKLAGKIVIFGDQPEVKPIVEAPYVRYTEKSLADISDYEIPSEKAPFRFREYMKRRECQKEMVKFLADEKALAV